MKKITQIAAIALAAISYPLLAEDLVHKPSGITVPDRLGGLPHAVDKSYYDGDLDYMFDFASDAQRSEIVSIFVFRNVSGNASLWFDRADASVRANQRWGTVSAATGPTAFQPSNQKVRSGLRASYGLNGQGYTSSALAIAPVGEWYVKVRATSSSRSPEEMDRWLDEIIAELGLFQPTNAAPEAKPIEACANTLKFKKKAKAVRQNANDQMMAALLGGVAANLNAETQSAADMEVLANAVTWCREDYAIAPSGVYRADGSTDSYLLALGDSGRAVGAGLDGLIGLVSNQKKKHYGISYILPDKTLIFAPRDGLPSPEQALEIAQKDNVISSSSTLDGKSEITINTK